MKNAPKHRKKVTSPIVQKGMVGTEDGPVDAVKVNRPKPYLEEGDNRWYFDVKHEDSRMQVFGPYRSEEIAEKKIDNVISVLSAAPGEKVTLGGTSTGSIHKAAVDEGEDDRILREMEAEEAERDARQLKELDDQRQADLKTKTEKQKNASSSDDLAKKVPDQPQAETPAPDETKEAPGPVSDGNTVNPPDPNAGTAPRAEKTEESKTEEKAK